MRHPSAALSWFLPLVALAGCGPQGSSDWHGDPLVSGPLEIHYIDVGWGGSVFVKGPDGTTVLLEAGNTGMGTNAVVPYLQSIGLTPSTGLDYTVAGHQHCDHVGGLDEVVKAGYNVHLENFYNGSTYASTCVDGWNTASATTSAGAPQVPAVGSRIALGGGAQLTFVAVNGAIIGGGAVSVTDENDRSIAALVQYGGFEWLWASDLGGGSGDNACTGRSTTQVDVESSVVQAISPGGAAPLISSGGVDVLHVNHHGSESSTNANWMNYAKPALAVVSVGAGETTGWDLPRIDVVDHVLLASSAACVTAPPALVLQTEEGSPTGTNTSFSGYSVGNIKISTDGQSSFTVDADGRVTQGPNEVVAAGLPRTILLDDDRSAPTTAITSPAAGASVTGTVSVTASATDNVGVTRVEFYLDGALVSTSTASPYAWSWNTSQSATGTHTLQSRAYDVAGNVGSSAIVSVTVSIADTTPPTAPSSLTAAGGTRKITLAWKASTDNVGVAGYQVWRATSSSGTYSKIATTTSLGYVDGLTTGTKRYYYVKAFDAAGNVSAASNKSYATAK